MVLNVHKHPNQRCEPMWTKYSKAISANEMSHFGTLTINNLSKISCKILIIIQPYEKNSFHAQLRAYKVKCIIMLSGWKFWGRFAQWGLLVFGITFKMFTVMKNWDLWLTSFTYIENYHFKLRKLIWIV